MTDHLASEHVLIDVWGCGYETLNSVEKIAAIFDALVEKYQLTVVKRHFHPFPQQGLTGFYLLAASHLTIHTWPEHDYAALDLFICGARVEAIADDLCVLLNAQRRELRFVTRGPLPPE